MQKKIKTSSEARRSPHLVDLTLLQNTNTDSGRLSAGSKSWRKVMANPVVMPDEIETKVIEEPEQIVEAKEEPEPVSVQEIPAPIKPRRRFVFKRVVKRMFNRTFYRFCVGLGHLVVAAVSLLFAPARLIGRTMGFFRQYFEDKSIKRSQLRLERLDKYLSERPVEQVGKEREIVSAKEPEPILEEVTESKIEEEPFFELPLTRAMRLRTVMAFALVLIVLSLPLRGILMYTSAAEVESKVLNAVRQGVSNL
ncbi:hypothetical protein HGA64_05800, partial [Candidatus Falkowbacteria bacterium]|nr:hypothetical protein [Candidatus Falkowbacteria bacterium]